WGGLAAGGEHGYWAMRLAIHERSWTEPHATVHYFMAGAYTAIAGVLLGVIALTLFGEGRRSGWFVVLFVTLVGGGFELKMNGPTGYLYHHIGLYAYVAAWLAALVIAYTPTFSPVRSTARLESSATDMEHLWSRAVATSGNQWQEVGPRRRRN